MKPADTYILEFMAMSGGWLKPASIALNVLYSANWAGQPCRELSERRLLEHDDENSAYRISDKGKRAAGGEIDAGEVE
jgi:predicted transcriptional regulator